MNFFEGLMYTCRILDFPRVFPLCMMPHSMHACICVNLIIRIVSYIYKPAQQSYGSISKFEHVLDEASTSVFLHGYIRQIYLQQQCRR